MATVETARDARVEVCSVEDLKRDGHRVVSVDGRAVLVLYDQGKVFALDNRCPHMGFPLHRGTVRDGILTCHWHHAKFDLAGGCTFDPFADDVRSFHAEIRNSSVWLDPTPIEEDRETHWLRKLDDGLKHNISIVQAKSVVGLAGAGATGGILENAALFSLQILRASVCPAPVHCLYVRSESDRRSQLGREDGPTKS